MQNSEAKRVIWGIMFITWSALIILFSVIPDDGLSKMGLDNSGFRWDYLEHLGVFCVFAILYLQWRKADTRKKRITGLLIIGILLAISTEFFQLFIKSRSFNYIDLLFNVAGLTVGTSIYSLLYRIRSSSAT